MLTRCAGSTSPPMATYTPGVVSVDSAPTAQPRLNPASESLCCSGRIEPVMTTILLCTPAARYRAVSSCTGCVCTVS